mgnify:CR=1 FL=1
MARDFTINTIEQANLEYDKQYETSGSVLPIIFGTNNIITTKKDSVYSVKTGN